MYIKRAFSAIYSAMPGTRLASTVGTGAAMAKFGDAFWKAIMRDEKGVVNRGARGDRHPGGERLNRQKPRRHGRA
jgi:hypothetical protein